MKKQIIKHSEHQFIEGDVEHWWHDETKRGIRTKFSDDLLWLVFVTNNYIKVTGDKDILKEQVLAKVSAIYKKERLVKLDSKKYAFYVKTLPLRRFWLKNLFRINNMFRKIFKGR